MSRSRRESDDPRLRWHVADLLDPSAAEQLVAATEPERMVHAAWVTEHGEFWSSSENRSWVEATLRLWCAFADHGGRRFVGVGSCAEYEWPGAGALSEASSPLRPHTLYGESKDTARRKLEEASSARGLSFAWARLFFAFGPDEDPRRLLPSVADALLAGRTARVTTPDRRLDLLRVEDMGAALAALLESSAAGAVNVGSGAASRIGALAGKLGLLAGESELVSFEPKARDAIGDADVVADVTRLRDEVGWKPAWKLEDGLADFLELRRSTT